MPWLKINSERALAFTTTLINISCCVVVNFQHGYQTITVTISATDVAITCSDAMDSKSDSSSVFTNNSALFKCVINSVDGVFTHC
jgi:hypothetical protein